MATVTAQVLTDARAGLEKDGGLPSPCIVVYFGNTVARVAAVVQIAMAWPPFTSSDAPETKLASWEVR